MKVVILAGGLGTRIPEETVDKPKPMVKIGEMPIIWHIMKIFSNYGINDFVVCSGYKEEKIHDYFKKIDESWNVDVIDTGVNTMTGGRLKKIEKFVSNETFCMTYGDDLKLVDIPKLINFHRKKKKFVTLTTFQPAGRFGLLKLNGDSVLQIFEKIPGDGYWYNGGYYVLEPEIFDYLENDLTVWENNPLNKLAEENQVSAFHYSGIYQPMDTIEDKNKLEKMWKSGKAYWKIW